MNTKYHIVKNISFEGSFMKINIDNRNYSIDLREHSKKLAGSNLQIKNNYKVSPSGYGIHWEDIDEDLSFDGILKSISTREKNSSYSSLKKLKSKNTSKVSEKRTGYKNK
jgi:hypothetical protein